MSREGERLHKLRHETTHRLRRRRDRLEDLLSRGVVDPRERERLEDEIRWCRQILEDRMTRNRVAA